MAIKEIIEIIILVCAMENEPNPDFFIELAREESQFTCTAKGKLGEYGLFQIMPETWKLYTTSNDWTNPYINTMVAIKHINMLKNKFPEKDYWFYLLCYNAGCKWYYDEVSPPKSTILYANRIYKRLNNRGV